MKREQYWSPYVAGALSGVVAIASLWFTGKFMGASTTFVKTTAMLENIFAPETVKAMPYFIKNTPVIDWQWMFVLGIGLGALIAAVTSGTFKVTGVPDMWKARFGETPKKRAAIAFIGGCIAMFGARLADGCPSGHGLAGVSQLAISGFVALIMFFVGGVISANLLYKGGENK